MSKSWFENHRDWVITVLVSMAHGASHFSQLILPSLFVSLNQAFHLSFTQLGLLVSIYFAVSSLTQTVSGFIVDKISPRPVLWFGLSGLILSALLISIAHSYQALGAAALIGGIGNGIFHPADYSLLNKHIDPKRVVHSFSIHSFTGSLGWALCPVFMASLIVHYNWRIATLMAALVLALILVFTIFGRHLLGNNSDLTTAYASVSKLSSPRSNTNLFYILRVLMATPALWCAFLFFLLTSIALSAVQNYTIPLLVSTYGLSKIVAGSGVSTFMLAAAAGMLLGGFFVSAHIKVERLISITLVLAGLTLLILAFGHVAPIFITPLLLISGFCAGVTAPSRDMLIRQISPKVLIGSVYGLIYAGMDIGSALGPWLFGLTVDAGFSHGPWLGAGMAFLLTAILTQIMAQLSNKKTATA